GALDQHRAHLVIVGRAPRRFDEAARHIRIERVTAVRPGHGDGEQAAVGILQDDFVCAHGGWLSLLFFPVIPGRAKREPGISRSRVWSFGPSRDDGATSSPRHFFTSGQRDSSSGWNASLPATVPSSL